MYESGNQLDLYLRIRVQTSKLTTYKGKPES